MKRFKITADQKELQADFTTEMLELVKELQNQNITPIEVLDNENKTTTLYRKGTHDKNYFVRTKDVHPYAEGDSGLTTTGNTGGDANQMYQVQKVAKSKKSRTVKPESDETK